jgi:hypothetical protein
MKTKSTNYLVMTLVSAAMVTACGNELATNTPSPTPQPGNGEANPGPSASPSVSPSPSASPSASPSPSESPAPSASPAPSTGPDANGKYNLKVDGGYGSGAYAPGETVYVWSGVSTTTGVALPWTGDASLLKNPSEWISTFVMPSRNVSMAANSAVQNLQLKVETYKGSTNVDKTVRYFFPPAMKGLVFMSHGTGGNSSYIDNTETFTIALALVKRGFGVLSTEAEEAPAGDLNGDGKQRWQTGFTANNIDLKNLSILLTGLEQRGLITANTPKFALGMSNGGAFSHFLGAIGASSIANSFPKLRFKAVVGYCSDSTQISRNSNSRTPSAWYMCGGEDNPEVSNAEARENESKLKAAGVPTEYYENPASPLYDERFTRITGITPETSKAIANELRAGGFVDAKGFLNKDADEIALEIIQPQNASKFPTLVALPESGQNRVKNQLKVLRAEHAQYGDQVERNILFFEKFL